MNNLSYQEIIEEQGFYIATPLGNSMLPMLRNRIDSVKIVKPQMPLRKGALVLYQRKNGAYIVHRIVKIKNGKYVMCGDGEWRLEKGIKSYQIIGQVEGFYRKEKYISCSSFGYRLYVFIWTKLRFIRFIFGFLFRGKNTKNH